jgi:hypothetical protein
MVRVHEENSDDHSLDEPLPDLRKRSLDNLASDITMSLPQNFSSQNFDFLRDSINFYLESRTAFYTKDDSSKTKAYDPLANLDTIPLNSGLCALWISRSVLYPLDYARALSPGSFSLAI